MKRYLALPIVFVALLALTQIASAGPERYSAKDKEVAMPAPPECNWTGFYIGANVGYGGGYLDWNDDGLQRDASPPEDPHLVSHPQTGAFGGGTIGYNYQFGKWVIGAEGTFDYSDARERTVVDLVDSEPSSFYTHNDWFGTAGLRFGYAWNRVLFYVKGAADISHNRFGWLHQDEEFLESFKAEETHVGGLIGVGTELMINCHWSAKIEYGHTFFPDFNISGTHLDSGVPQGETYKISLVRDAVQLGLNYKF